MDTLNTSDKNPEDEKSANPANAPLQSATKISAAIRSLIQNGNVEDMANQKIIMEALAFIEHPAEDLAALENHMLGIAMVLAEYGEMENQPPEINAIQHQLYGLAAQHYIELIEKELGLDVCDNVKITALLKKAKNYAGILAKYYNDRSAQDRITILEQQLNPSV
jgi:hypothetical protein